MNEREVTFQDKQGRKIVGTLLTPEGEGPFPVVIICHGFRVYRNQTHLVRIAKDLAEKGIASLRFDFTAGTGESSLPLEEMTISYELEVLDEATKFVRNQKELHQKRIGLVGHSLGGLVTSWYAATHPEIASICTLSAVYSFLPMWNKHPDYGDKVTKDMKEKGFALIYSNTFKKNFRMNIGFYNDSQQYNMDKVIDNLVCPILIVAGTSDAAVTIDHAQHYYDRAFSRQKELKIIKGSDHNYTNPENLAEVSEAVAAWFKKTLAG